MSVSILYHGMIATHYIIVRPQNTGIYKIYNLIMKALGCAPKGLRVINSVDPCILKSNLLDYRLVIVPLQLPVTSRQQENVAAISSNINW